MGAALVVGGRVVVEPPLQAVIRRVTMIGRRTCFFGGGIETFPKRASPEIAPFILLQVRLVYKVNRRHFTALAVAMIHWR